MIPIQHIHPMLVHFPIVLIVLLVGFDLIATFAGYNITGRTSTGNLSTAGATLAGISAIAAMVFGDMALEFAESSGFFSEIAEMHEELGESTAIVLGAWAIIRIFLWWRNMKLPTALNYAIPFVSVLCLGLVTATAFYGGQLVFDLGVNVTQG
jgi:uncharacterized membrane protein